MKNKTNKKAAAPKPAKEKKVKIYKLDKGMKMPEAAVSSGGHSERSRVMETMLVMEVGCKRRSNNPSVKRPNRSVAPE